MKMVKAVILAGGYAKRLWPLTENNPKALLTIAGKPIIDYIIEKIDVLDEVDVIYISTNEKFEKQFKEWIDSSSFKKKVELVIEKTKSETEKLGAIAGIQYLIDLKKVDDDLLVIAGDNMFECDLNNFMKLYYEKKSPVIGFQDIGDKEQAKKYGVASLNDDGKVVEFVEKPEEPKSSLISTAIYLFPKDDLGLFDEYLSNSDKKDAVGIFVSWLIEQRDVYCFSFPEEWYDIGDLKVYEEVDKIYTRKKLKEISDKMNSRGGKMFLVFDMENTLIKVSTEHFKKVVSNIVSKEYDDDTIENFQRLIELRNGMIEDVFGQEIKGFWSKFQDLEGQIPRDSSLYDGVNVIAEIIKGNPSILFTNTNPSVAVGDIHESGITSWFDYVIYSHERNNEEEKEFEGTSELFTSQDKSNTPKLEECLKKLGLEESDTVFIIGDSSGDMGIAKRMREDGFNAYGVLLMREDQQRCRSRVNDFFDSGCDVQIKYLNELKELIQDS